MLVTMASPPYAPSDTSYLDGTIVVPTYKENENLRPLIERIFMSLKEHGNMRVQVLIVDDDSRDGSVETVEALKREGYDVRIIVRKIERGLSSAVIHGFQVAAGDKLLCMDADLQVITLVISGGVVAYQSEASP